MTKNLHWCEHIGRLVPFPYCKICAEKYPRIGYLRTPVSEESRIYLTASSIAIMDEAFAILNRGMNKLINDPKLEIHSRRN